jgi:hypothetical protein
MLTCSILPRGPSELEATVHTALETSYVAAAASGGGSQEMERLKKELVEAKGMLSAVDKTQRDESEAKTLELLEKHQQEVEAITKRVREREREHEEEVERLRDESRASREMSDLQVEALREEMNKFRQGESERMGDYVATHLKAVSGCVKMGIQALICSFTHVNAPPQHVFHPPLSHSLQPSLLAENKISSLSSAVTLVLPGIRICTRPLLSKHQAASGRLFPRTQRTRCRTAEPLSKPSSRPAGCRYSHPKKTSKDTASLVAARVAVSMHATTGICQRGQHASNPKPPCILVVNSKRGALLCAPAMVTLAFVCPGQYGD